MNEYWVEQFRAVGDGGMLTNEAARLLVDYLLDLRMAINQCMNEPLPHRWIAVSKVLEAGPKEPEP